MNNNFIEDRIGRIDQCDGDIRKTAQEMDMIRQRTLAYEYLCRLEEAKIWMEACLKEKLPSVSEIEENFRNGVYLAKLAHFIAPDLLPKNKIYDIEQRRYQVAGLQFKHTENINKFLQILRTTELPTTFQPETTDIYDKKNMPRFIYCIHALSTHLFKLGKAPLIQDVFGKAVFTDEQLDSVSKDLEKLNNTIPSFQKITGILSKRHSNDINGLHEAILHLNQLLDTNQSIEKALRNKHLNIKFICKHLMNDYKKVLLQAKLEKIQVAQNHSINDSYVPDEYDEVLTQPEVQGHVTATNFKYSWSQICKAAAESDLDAVRNVLKSDWIAVTNVNDDNLDYYCDIVNHLNENSQQFNADNVVNWNKIYQGIINEGNARSEENLKHKIALKHVNQALEDGDPDKLYEALTNKYLELKIKITRYAVPLYYEELKLDRNECGKDLNESEIASSISSLSAIANVSEAVERGDEIFVWQALSSNKARVERLRLHCRQRYANALSSALKVKKQAALCPVLTYDDIQDCVDMVNEQDDQNEELIEVINTINKAVSSEDTKSVMALLKTTSLNIKQPIFNEEAPFYMRLLKKALTGKEGMQLWLEDVHNVVNDVYLESNQVKKLTESLVRINLALSNMKLDDLIEALLNSCFDIDAIEDQYKNLYYQAFNDYFKKKNKYTCPWVVCHTDSGNTVYIDIESYTHRWQTPKDFDPHSRYLSKKDVETILKRIRTHHLVKYKTQHLERLVKKIQAYCRGYLYRKRMAERMEYLARNEKSVVLIQAWWRMVLVKRKYGSVVKVRTLETLIRNRRRENPWAWYKLQEQKIIKIQALWRGKRARRAFEQLFHSENPPFKVVRHFIPLLDFSTEDYEKEIELQNLKSEVVQSIRRNHELSRHLDDMDVKIGLLVQNRITLQDVAAHGLKLNNLVRSQSTSKLTFNVMQVTTAVKGLKSLTKESKRLLDGYQHLFYELQTNPKYLSKLLFCIPQNKTNQFLQNVIMSLFNFGSNPRDEYLLLKLFRYALEEEINCKVSKPFDVITNNPIVLKMAVSHSRQMAGLTNLRNMIGPLIEKMLDDKDLNMETGPVEIFKAWRNEIEMKTGKISQLPLTVSQEEALSYPEVQKRLEAALTRLQSVVTAFIERISSSMHLMPYCITYMARVLHRCLIAKFPGSPEKEILKVVGNLVYYQFINAAIVAPDAFHIIEVSRERENLTAGQRRNLASVAKILQFASAKKGFGDESKHLRCLNPFIVECHERMKTMFKQICKGPSLEEYFCVDEYTEATLMRTPYIYITIQEIVNTHSLLLEYQDIIAPDPDEKLNILLEELGDVPSAMELASRDATTPASVEALARLDVCLALVNKFQHVGDDMTDINKLFIRTKELCVSVIPYLNGEHLLEALCLGTTAEQNEAFENALRSKPKPATIRPDQPATLRAHIALLRKYIDQLEEQGYVSRLDGYQSLVTSIALDLCNKGKYRRAQRKTLTTLRRTRLSLQEKTRFYEEQVRYYQQYVNTCLDNLNAGKRSVHNDLKKFGKKAEKLKSKLTAKYSAAKLYEKGILLEIVGLQQSQFKNVQFEITPTELNGIFTVRGKFLGVEMERIDVDIQDLLQKQYEGVAVMDMFGKAKINVNLLIFLLNSKFYGKH